VPPYSARHGIEERVKTWKFAAEPARGGRTTQAEKGRRQGGDDSSGAR